MGQFCPYRYKTTAKSQKKERVQSINYITFPYTELENGTVKGGKERREKGEEVYV